MPVARSSMAVENVIAYIVICMIIGIIGNLFVIYVFGFRYRASPFNTLITTLAVYDLLSSLVHMPLDVVETLHPNMLPYSILCKVACTLVSLTVFTSSIVLLSVAIIRYRGVSNPLARPLTINEARVIGVLPLIPAVCLSWPIGFLFENKAMETDSDDQRNMCGIHDDSLVSYALAFHIVLLTLFVANFVTLAVLYGMIARFIINRKRVFSEATKGNVTVINIGILDNTTSDPEPVMNSNASPEEPPKRKLTDQRSPPKERKQERHSNNGLLMMFLVTLIFCVSYMPHLSYAMIGLLSKMEGIVSVAPTTTFGVLFRSYYINNFANPIIYAVCSGDFRAEVVRLFHRFGRTKK